MSLCTQLAALGTPLVLCPSSERELMVGERLAGVLLLALLVVPAGSNTTAYWLGRRAALIDGVLGLGPGVLPTRTTPDHTVQWPEAGGVTGLDIPTPSPA